MGQMIKAYTVIVRKPKGNRTLERPRFRWEGKQSLSCVVITLG
jgi:hypothetical protein